MAGNQPIQGTSPDDLAQLNKSLAQLNAEQQTKVFRGPGGYNATIIGRLPNDLGYGLMFSDASRLVRVYIAIDNNGAPVLKVSQSGYDATTAPDANLTFNSSRNVFKIVKTDTFTSPALDAAGGANDTSTVVTDTGIASATPLAYVSYVVNDSGGYNQLPLISINYSGLFQMYRTMSVELGGGNVKLRTYSQNFTGFSTAAVTIKYYLFAESAV